MSLDYNAWSAPDIEAEMGEIERTASALSPLDASAEFARLLEAIKVGESVNLSDDVWSRLENSDSWDIRVGHIEDVTYHTNENGRDAAALEAALRNGTSMLMPIIVIKKDGTPYTVSGNTRLMLARALGITPKVFVARL